MNVKKLSFAIIILFLNFIQGYSQTVEDAETLFLAGDYKNAYILYDQILLTTPKPKKELIFNTAKCAYFLEKYNETINLLEPLKTKNPEKNLLLGDAYFKNYFFDNAIFQFDEFLLTKDTVDAEYELVNQKLKQATLGRKFLRRVEDITFIDSVIVSKSEAIERIFLSKEAGKISRQEGILNEQPIDLINFTTERGNETYLSDIHTHNTDLYLSETLLDGKTEKKELKELNTSYDENYPFLLLDGVTLYFSSNGSQSMGGHDIFITQLNRSDNHYVKPENVGMPFNSPFNDYLLAIDEVNKLGWLISDRYQKKGKVAIYRFIPNDEKKIVKTESLDSLRKRAIISTFYKNAYIPRRFNKLNITKEQPLILIKDNLYYQKASDFKSQEARKYYYQSKKIRDSILQAKKSLKRLRKKYHSFKKGKKKDTIAKKIIELEKHLLKQVPQQKELEKKMRNSEIKHLKNL